MECIIFNIETPLNYDIGFPANPECVGFPDIIKNKERKKYGKLDLDTLDEIELGTLITIRVRLANIAVMDKKNKGIIKHNLLYINNECGGVFTFKGFNIDYCYGRIYGDLTNIITGETLSDWLITHYPNNFKKYKVY